MIALDWTLQRLAIPVVTGLGLLLFGGIFQASRGEDAPDPQCSPPPAWLPTTPPAIETAVPKPRPATDCAFYGPAWQRFLNVTQPNGTSPAFLSYPAFDDLFASNGTSPAAYAGTLMSLTPRTIQRANAVPHQPAFSDIAQAGLRGVLIDQRGRPIYYAIHVNPAFAAFLKANDLTTPSGIGKMNTSLTFPTGVVELKSAWMIVDGVKPDPTYFVVPAQVPHYVVLNGVLTPKLDPVTKQPVLDTVHVALIALHVVFTLPGHPEMIWSTFEHIHTDASGKVIRDDAPAAASNPSATPADTVISTQGYILYKARTPAAAANKPVADAKMLAARFDEVSQSFTKGGGILQTSVYRPYPGSKTDGKKAHDSDEDDEVEAINMNMTKLFATSKLPKTDQRQYYRLVGAVWINDPEKDFKVNTGFSDPLNVSTDEDISVLAGEGRLASTAMESFTEFEDTMNGSPNCFSCHDTNRVVDDIDPTKKLLPPAMLNVSHVLSRYVDQQKSHNP